MRDGLIFLPTYNERDNVAPIYQTVRRLVPEAQILFVDDNSPDGTGEVLDALAARDPRLAIIHRPGKLGIGSAHKQAIAWAYERGYATLVTMDADFAHKPEYILQMIDRAEQCDVVVGTRFEHSESLDGWHIVRKLLTHTGHILTRVLLGLPYDATGAFRVYRLGRIARPVFDEIRSDDYAFFFESLHVLHRRGFAIRELPIQLPPRTYGSSKMQLADVFRGFARLIATAWRARFAGRTAPPGAAGSPRSEWDSYWSGQRRGGAGLYDILASFYREHVIKRALNHFLRRHFPAGARVLHAGCGGGQVDIDIVRHLDVTALDISTAALHRYARENRGRALIVGGDLFRLPFADTSFAGVYNLGVMEHFQAEQIVPLLRELHRVLRPGGRVVLFWPPEFGLSVRVLGLVHWILNDVLRRNVHLHPPEPSRVPSCRQARAWLAASGFEDVRLYFGPRDLFTHLVVMARRGEKAA